MKTEQVCFIMASSTTEDGLPAAPQTLGVPGNGEPLLLDLSFLTEEEREKLKGVLQADQELKTRDRIRLGYFIIIYE